MGKYVPDDIKKILQQITDDPQTLKTYGKTQDEMQKTFELLTEPENLYPLTELCNILDEMRESEENK